MTAERESMTLQEMDAPALGVEERRDEAPRGGASHARPTPDPEVVAGGGRELHAARRGGPAASPRGSVQLPSDGMAQGAA